ncbi:hypothetical protein AVEN_129871-1 [Araneus ventricosus]|uniref:Uncharacterized protein n=1 Tax=Araneus ventricosus TaxID=182803 RepID=A0A4Y2AZK5_ARAVE|nr:hypothetical protein AVEN_129871-1 [Araneus ventricosus]
MSDTYSAWSINAWLDITSDVLIFGTFLFEIFIVSRCISENGTFERPEAVLGSMGQATEKRDCPVQNGAYGHIRQSRMCAWESQSD